MTNVNEITVVAHDTESIASIPRRENVRVVSKIAPHAASARNLFVLTSASKLQDVAELVRESNKRHRLRALFVRENVDARFLPQLLEKANLRVLRNTLVHSGPEIPRRVLSAWQSGNKRDLIATAYVAGNELVVITCALEVLTVRFDEWPALNQIPHEHRGQFTISEEGSYIHWPAEDIHLDVDAIRYATDPSWRAEKIANRVMKQKHFGRAVAQYRKARGLRQADIEGLSSRQVRRIESGEPASFSSLETLAISHGLPFEVYLNEIANLLRHQHAETDGKGNS